MANEKRIVADVDEKLHKQIRIWSIQDGIPIQDAIIAFLKALLRGDPAAKKIAEEAKKK